MIYFIEKTLIGDDIEHTSLDKPLKIPSEIDDFVKVEHELVEGIAAINNYYEWKKMKQILKFHNGKKIDIIEIIYKLTKNQKEYDTRSFYFDITEGFNNQYE